MVWVNIIALIILCFSLLGGMKEGAVKNFFSLAIQIFAIYIAGHIYHLLATVLSFLPGTSWENFLGFFITMGLIMAIVHLIVLIPRKIIQKIWKRGLIFRLLGGALKVFSTSIGLAVFTLAIGAFPIIDWLARVIVNAGVLQWLVAHLGFVQAMLPEVFRNAASLMATL
ncbi:CvpA family protein [Chloroflexota bacterium]